jgi:membrane protease YdiL (CAAX protease family)
MHSFVNLSAVAQHLLMVFLVVVGPVWDYFDTRPLKANPSSAARLGYYFRTILWLWTASCVALWTTGWTAPFTLSGLGFQDSWIETHRWAWWVGAAFVTLLVLMQLVLPVVQVTVKYRDRSYLEPRQFELLRFFLPATALERRWFVVLSLSAGFCEELLFRGFLLRYLHTWPLHLNLAMAALLAAIVFAAHHIYQGRAGVTTSMVGGLVFTVILLVSGSLLAGMLFHALADVSLLLYWRPRTLLSEEGPAT